MKLGVDPTTSDIHLGHTIVLRKLRQFQDLGHQAILIIGDFTGMIGDPSGRSVTRPQLTHNEVLANAATYREQAFKILDPARTETVCNGDWFRAMSFEDVIRLNSRVTLQQMLQREDFKTRIDNQQSIRAHEIQYPIMQGWDSVMVKADVELGGTDQLFNILIGRDFQKEEGLPQQVVFLLPILEGLDGSKKMSKSLGNFVAINEPAADMFGKLMSISDDLMARYYPLLLGRTPPATCIRSKPRSNSRSKSCRPITRWLLPKRRSTSGTRALASAIWNMPIFLHFQRLQGTNLQPSRSSRTFIGKCSTSKNPTAKSRD